MDFLPRTESHLRQTAEGLVLLGTRNDGAAALQFPPARGAHAGEQLVDEPIGPEGTLYTFTTVHPGAGQPPYQLAMVDFEPDIRILGRVVASTQPASFGAKVRIVPFTLPDGSADYAFETV
jgi:uncharacterized OB-fold protein